MLAEKFFLVLETLLSNASSDIIIVSAAPHEPVKLPLAHTHAFLQHRRFMLRAARTGNLSPI